MSQAPSDVYARQLFPKKYGIPLFIPKLYDNLSHEYRDRGTSIGDVGIITTDGSFSFIFNICTAASDPINCNGVPDGFEQILLNPNGISHLNNMHSPGSDVSSASVEKESIALEGALKDNKCIQVYNLLLVLLFDSMLPRFLNVPVGAGASYRFTSASSEVAILTMPEGAAHQDLTNLTQFR